MEATGRYTRRTSTDASALARKEAEVLPRLARFEVLRVLGRGGMGVVFAAIDREKGEHVALKMLATDDPQRLLLLKREFRGLQDIQHPNLVRLGELLCEGATWFFTMQLIEGCDFRVFVRGDAPSEPVTTVRGSAPVSRPGRVEDARSSRLEFDESRLRAGLRQLAEGLRALHAASRVHRDLKPSNVLVDARGHVTILDFSLVVDPEGEGVEEELAGTAPYMAPEQVMQTNIGAPADLYALGAVLYECLTGRRPFEGPVGQVLELKLLEEPVAPSALVSGVPDDLDALCLALLAREPEDRPTAEEVVERLTGATSPTGGTRARDRARVSFVGRTEELAEVEAAFAAACEGAQTTVIVEGESGVGKSALVRRFTKALGADTLVLAARCYEREAVPFKAVDGVVDALARVVTHLDEEAATALIPESAHLLSRAFPIVRGVPAMMRGERDRREVSQQAVFDAFRDVIASIAAQRPLVVAIDDLQWADADSLALLAAVLRAPAPPFLLLATARAKGEGGGGAPSLGLPGEPRVVRLSRLSSDDTMALACALLGDDAGSDARIAAAIVSESAGHPLFIEELARHAREVPGSARGGVVLDEVISQRIALLEGGARRIVETLAIAGTGLAQETVARAAELPLAELARHVHALRAAHLVRTSGVQGRDEVELYHDRVRETVAARLDSESRRACHERIAAALEARGDPEADAEALTVHWLEAGEPMSAGRYARRAADAAQRGFAFEHAARLYALALEHAGLPPDAEQAVRLRMATVLGNAGHGGEAAKVYLDAASRAAPDDALDLRRRAAEEMLIAGRLDEGERMLAEVLGAVHLRLPTRAIDVLLSFLWSRLRLFLRGYGARDRAEAEISPAALRRFDTCCSVSRALTFIETLRGAYFSSRATLLALALGEPRRLSFALSFESGYLAVLASRRRKLAPEINARAAALAERVGDETALAMSVGTRAFIHFISGRFAAAHESADSAVDFVRERCPGAFWELRTYQMTAVWSLAWMGELKQLGARVDRASREAERRGDRAALTMLWSGQPNLSWLLRGEPDEARRVVDEAARLWTQRGYHNQHYWRLLALTQIDLYTGDAERAYARVGEQWGAIKRGLILEIPLLRHEALYMRARVAVAAAARANDEGRRVTLLRAAERDARRLARADAPYGPGLGALVQAGVAWNRRQKEVAAEHLSRGAALLDGVPMRLHAAAARLHLARLREDREEGSIHHDPMAFFRGQGVSDALRMAHMAVAGFDESGGGQ